MDLIYTDKDRFELGALMSYSLDFDATAEKDFEIKSDNYVDMIGGWFYIDGTEYGGRIDDFQVNTSEKTYTYKGRNFRGILASKIMYTDNQILANGDITDEGNTRLAAYGLDSLFVFDATDVDDEVPKDVTGYKYIENTTLYDGLVSMAESINFILSFSYNSVDKKVHILPTMAEDYSEYISYCQDNAVNFTIEDKKGGINHLICTGLDDSNNKKTIHLFTDENGGVQPYALTDTPIQESDYILDKRNQILTGLDEIMGIYDATSISPVENYVLTTSKPKNWDYWYAMYYKLCINSLSVTVTRCTANGTASESGKYFKVVSSGSYYGEETELKIYIKLATEDEYIELLNITSPTNNIFSNVVNIIGGSYDSSAAYTIRVDMEDVSLIVDYKNAAVTAEDSTQVYNSVEPKIVESYALLEKIPSDWYSNCAKYYTQSEAKSQSGKITYEYQSVSEEEIITGYTATRVRPPNWIYAYSEYYSRSFDGVHYNYEPVSGVTVSHYIKQTRQPSDWYTNYGSYYRRTTKKERKKKKTKKKWVAVTLVKKKKKKRIPKWKKNKYYTKIDTVKAPKWPGKVYVAITGKRSPAFTRNQYYIKNESSLAPTWTSKTYYDKVKDYYSSLVESGIDELKESANTNSQTVTLGEFDVSIGDTVGGSDDATGMSVCEKVTNMIIKIEDGVITSLEHTIGGTN